MKVHPYLAAVALLLALAACRPGAAEYTNTEAPKNLVLNRAASLIDVRFFPGSARLIPRDAARLRVLAATGRIAPSDQVTVSVAGLPGLAAARVGTVAQALLPYRIIASAGPHAGVAANHALIDTGRYLVTLPPCPNWSREPSSRFTNTFSSNYGCATAVDLAQSIASPADLAEGRPVGLAEGLPAVDAVNNYLLGKVQLPQAATGLGVVTTPTSTSSAGGAGSAGTGP